MLETPILPRLRPGSSAADPVAAARRQGRIDKQPGSSALSGVGGRSVQVKMKVGYATVLPSDPPLVR